MEKPNPGSNPRIRRTAAPGSVPPRLPGKRRSVGPFIFLVVFLGLFLMLAGVIPWRQIDRARPGVRPPWAQPAAPQNGRGRPLPAPFLQVKAEPNKETAPSGPSAAVPEFSKPGGLYLDELTLELKTQSPSATIRYTLDGSDPTPASRACTGPIQIASTTLVRAKCFEPGRSPSPTATQVYSLVDGSVADFTSNLPLVVINSFSSQISKQRYITASLTVIGAGGKRSALTSAPDFSGLCDIKFRGYSSLRLPKRSYTLKIKDETGHSLDVPLLGMPKDSDWVLYAPYADKTLMRNVLAYELSNRMGRYAPRTRFVEVFLLNRYGEKLSSRHYAGVYVLIEKIKRSPDRVNMQELTPADNREPNITGGYLFKRDHLGEPMDVPFNILGPRSPTSPDGDDTGFTTRRGLSLFYVDPKEPEITSAQKNWLRRYLNDFEQALYGSHFKSPTDGYAKYLDVDSFLDQFWIVELSKNVDGFRYSCYMYKDRGGKIRMEPIWDWNLSFGNANYHEGWMTENWYWPLLRENEVCWYRRLAQDPDFVQRQIDRWTELRRGLFSPEKLLARIDEIAQSLDEAQTRNYQRWRILGRQVHPNRYVGDSYENEVNFLKLWIKRRIAWIDSQFLPPPSVSSGRQTASGFVLDLSAESGTIQYTLDGTDPRLPGGGVSPQAHAYRAPIALKANGSVFARVRAGDDWSGPILLRPPTLDSARK